MNIKKGTLDLEAAKIIIKAAQKIGKTLDCVYSVIKKIVDDRGIHTLESLKNLSEDDWDNLCVPYSLINAIKNEINSTVLSTYNHVIEKEIIGQREATAFDDPQNKFVGQREATAFDQPLVASVQLETPEEFRTGVSFSEILNELQNEASTKNVLNNDLIYTLNTLLRIVDGLLETPYESRKRQIKVTSNTFQTYLAIYKSTYLFLDHIGFKKIDEMTFGMPVIYVQRLLDVRTQLELILKHKNVQTPPTPNTSYIFNPYKPSIVSPDTYSHYGMNHELERLKKLARDQIQSIPDKIERLHLLLKNTADSKNGIIPENPRIINKNLINKYQSETVKVVDPITLNTHVVTEEFTYEDFKSLLTPKTFHCKKKDELNRLERFENISKTTLTIRFPDRYELDLDFAIGNTVKNVYTVIQKYINPKIQPTDWILYENPIKTRLDPCKALYEQDLVPKAILYFHLQNHVDVTCYLNLEKCSQYLIE